MQELLDILGATSPDLKKGAFPRSSSGNLASFVHVLCHLLEIKEPAAKKIIESDKEACRRLVQIKLPRLRKPLLMGDAGTIAAALVAMKSGRVVSAVEKLPERLHEIANSVGYCSILLNVAKPAKKKATAEKSMGESAGPKPAKKKATVEKSTEKSVGECLGDISTAPDIFKIPGDPSSKSLCETILSHLQRIMERDSKEFCELINEAVPRSLARVEFQRYARFGRQQAEQLLETPYVELEKNGYAYYRADYKRGTACDEKIWKAAFNSAWTMAKPAKKTTIGLSLRDTIAETLPICAKILVARFFFTVQLWWKDIEDGKRRLWLTVGDAQDSFGKFTDTGSGEMRLRMNKKIPARDFFPGCLFGQTAAGVPRLYVKDFCPRFVQGRCTYALEKLLGTCIDRMMTSPCTDLEPAAESDLDPDQERAVGFSGNFQMVCGGPGTGKTLVLVRLARRHARRFPEDRIQIVAPTHKALGTIKTRFSKIIPENVFFNTCASAGHRFSDCQKARVLIVDECGMVGTKLLSRVFQKINPECACLFGDPNQLPPIDIGNPFGSLLQAATLPRVNLLRNHRQEGGGIRQAIEGVLGGEWRGGNADVVVTSKSVFRMGYNELRRYLNPLPDMVVSPTNRAVDFLNNAIYTLRYWSPVETGSRVIVVDPLSPDYRVGTVAWLRGSSPDSEALVRLDGATSPETFPYCMLRPLPFTAGRKLSLKMMFPGMRLRFVKKYKFKKNSNVVETEDRDCDVLQPNTLATCVETPGHVECVQCMTHAECQKHPALVSIMVDGEEEHRLVPLDCLALGWAYTVHKSQGSEEDNVMVVVAERDETWCDRSLLYVALSRAKKSLRVNATESQLRQIASRPPPNPCDLIALRVCKTSRPVP